MQASSTRMNGGRILRDAGVACRLRGNGRCAAAPSGHRHTCPDDSHSRWECAIGALRNRLVRDAERVHPYHTLAPEGVRYDVIAAGLN
jgi:hypothetical protein